MQRRGALEDDARSRLQLLTRMHQRFPAFARRCRRSRVEPRDQQTLDGAAARHTTAEQPRRKHSGVVDDEQIARLEAARQAPRSVECTSRSGRSRQVQQTRAAAVGSRFLRDQLGRQIEIEVANEHAVRGTGRGRNGRARRAAASRDRRSSRRARARSSR